MKGKKKGITRGEKRDKSREEKGEVGEKGLLRRGTKGKEERLHILPRRGKNRQKASPQFIGITTGGISLNRNRDHFSGRRRPYKKKTSGGNLISLGGQYPTQPKKKQKKKKS